jgi:hypothetical protein
MGYKYDITDACLSLEHMGIRALGETFADLQAGPPTGHAPAGSVDGLAEGYSLLDLKNRIKINLRMRKRNEMMDGIHFDLMDNEEELRGILANVLALRTA